MQSRIAAAPQELNRVDVRSYFVRERNAMVVRADFAPLYVDYYLHLMQNGIRLRPDHDTLLKDALAAFALHMVSRPWAENSSWTVHFQEPFLNLFVSGSSLAENVIGRAFLRDIKDMESNRFYQQTFAPHSEPRMSAITFDNNHDFLKVAEEFYQQSEQRPAKFFRYSPEDIVMVVAQPDCDIDWFESLDQCAILALDKTEELSLLENRGVSFHCGCSLDRLLPTLSAFADESLAEMFASDELLQIECPRCGANYEVSREQISQSKNMGK